MRRRLLPLSALLVGTIAAHPTYASEKLTRCEKDHNKPVSGQHAQTKSSSQQCEIDGKCRHVKSRINFGPYFYQDRTYTGSELLVNTPKTHETPFLLERYQKLTRECAQYGITLPKYPRLSLSGYLEGEWSFTRDYNNVDKKALQFTGAELVTYLQLNSWLSAFGAYDYDTELHDAIRIDTYRAYVVLGNLNKLPIYTSFGQMYVPFGQYSSLMAAAPYTRVLGRINALTGVIGYQGNNNLGMDLFGYRGKVKRDNFGGGVNYHFSSGKFSEKVGVDYVNNIADSAGFQDNSFTAGTPEPNYNVPAIDIYSNTNYGSWLLITEYVQALKHFTQADVPFANHGAKPSDWHIETGYSFNTFGQPSSAGVGYDYSSQALSLGIPQQAFSAVYNISVIKNSNLAIEYIHAINYPVKDASTGQSTSTLGKTSNEVIALFDYYF